VAGQETFGQMLSSARASRGWSFGDLARRLGLGSNAKALRRLVALEREAAVDYPLIEQLVAVLEMDRGRVADALGAQISADRLSWERWASEPVAPAVHWKPFCGFWLTLVLDADFPFEAALELARSYSRRAERRAVLEWNRRVSYWFWDGAEGNRVESAPDSPTLPLVTLAPRTRRSR
jgi:transcriptional regulator with XRE-family HTH domain